MGQNYYVRKWDCLVAGITCFLACVLLTMFLIGCETSGLPEKKPVMETGEVVRSPSGYVDWKNSKECVNKKTGEKMSERILGFREVKRSFEASTTNNEKIWAVFEEDLVSVRLASESVGLGKLKKFCERNRMNLLIHRDEKRQEGILLKDLLSWAEKEAKK